MRGGVLLTGLALALAAPGAAAVPGPWGANEESPVRTAPLAPGETLLQLGGVAFVTAPADRITFTIPVFADGVDQADARRANRARVQRIVEAARRAGLPADGVLAYSGSGSIEFSMIQGGPLASGAQARDRSMLILRMRDLGRAEAVRAAIAAEAGAEQYSPNYELVDTGPARQAAKTRALAAARADAEAYAAAHGLRVVRIARINERAATELLGLARSYRGERRQRRDPFERPAPEIEIVALLAVDFVLAPR
jgi:uncharacterized protein YggE